MAILTSKFKEGSQRKENEASRVEAREGAKPDKLGDGLWRALASGAGLGETIRVPARAFEGRRDSAPRRVDLRDMSEDQVRSLRTEDPFLYYSIPGVRAAEFSRGRVDFSDVEALCGPGDDALDTAGWENGSGEHRRRRRDAIVQRSSRVSFECHPDLIMTDLLQGLDDLSLDDDLSPFDDDCLALLQSLRDQTQ